MTSWYFDTLSVTKNTMELGQRRHDLSVVWKMILTLRNVTQYLPEQWESVRCVLEPRPQRKPM